MRINRLSSSKRIFEYNEIPHNEVQHNSVFNQKLEVLDFDKTNTPQNNYRMSDTINDNKNHMGNNNYKNKNEHRKIIWFNTPCVHANELWLVWNITYKQFVHEPCIQHMTEQDSALNNPQSWYSIETVV